MVVLWEEKKDLAVSVSGSVAHDGGEKTSNALICILPSSVQVPAERWLSHPKYGSVISSREHFHRYRDNKTKM